jgi:hypothetical protein
MNKYACPNSVNPEYNRQKKITVNLFIGYRYKQNAQKAKTKACISLSIPGNAKGTEGNR